MLNSETAQNSEQNVDKVVDTLPSTELVQYNKKIIDIKTILKDIVAYENTESYLVWNIRKRAYWFFEEGSDFETYNKNKDLVDTHYDKIITWKNEIYTSGGP